MDAILKELSETWALTAETLNHIKELMAQYAVDATVDSTVRKEAEAICAEVDKT